MLAPEEQQIEICLLKSNLEKIVDSLINQREALPELDAEYEQKSRATMAALKVVRSLKVEIERLNQENVHLTAKRMQLKRQCDDVSKNVSAALECRAELAAALTQVHQDTEMQIREYEDSLQKKAERFRKTHIYYDEEVVNKEIQKVNDVITDVKDAITVKQEAVDELRMQLDAIHPQVPESLLEIIGKFKLEEKVKTLTEKHEGLLQKRKSTIE